MLYEADLSDSTILLPAGRRKLVKLKDEFRELIAAEGVLPALDLESSSSSSEEESDEDSEGSDSEEDSDAKSEDDKD